MVSARPSARVPRHFSPAAALLGLVALAAPGLAAPPTIQCPSPVFTFEGQGFDAYVVASDPDGDPVVLSVVNPPARSFFDAEYGQFWWSPDFTQAGSYAIVFRAVAGGETVECTFNITIANFNRQPRITCPAPLQGVVGDTLRAQILGTDPDNDPLVFSGVGLPAGATISPSGAFLWPTLGTAAGTYAVNARVTDGSVTTACSFNVSLGSNQLPNPPVIFCPGPRAATETVFITFTINATDPLSRPLTYSAQDLPAGAQFDPATRAFSWTPSTSQSGTYQPRFFVSNNVNPPVSCSVLITVEDVTPPILSCPGPLTTPERVPLSFAISASSPLGFQVTYSAEDLPRGATFNPSTRVFSWTPGFDQAGVYMPRFVATNAFGSPQCTVPITVEDRPVSPPVITCPGDAFGVEQRVITFVVQVSDPEGDPITLTPRFMPPGSVFSPGNNSFFWIPTATQSGSYSVEFVATDGEGRDSCRVAIDVLDAPPLLNPLQPLLAGVRDVPADQGGWVRLRLVTPASDSPNVSSPVVGYNVWRRIAAPAGAPAAGHPELAAANPGLPPGSWESVGYTPAIQQFTMLLLAPTRADSGAAGSAIDVFAVTSHFATPSLWSSSPADSGWSVDNLAPAAPAARVLARADGAVVLAWPASPDLDLADYSIHTGDGPDFAVTSGNRLASTRDTTWIDPAPRGAAWYRVVAHDVHGNASASSAVWAGVESGGGVAPGLHLAAPRPSPSRGAVEFAFDLPAPGSVVVSVLDVRGRRVLRQVTSVLAAGPHRSAWDGRDDRGLDVPAGVYTVRLEAAGRVLHRKFVRL